MLLASRLVVARLSTRRGEAEERGAERGRAGGEKSRDEKGDVVAAIEGGQVAIAGS